MGLNDRVMTRLSGEEIKPDNTLVDEWINTITDRVNLLAGTDTLPDILGSIVVDAVVKMHRRKQYEGISSEGVDSMSTSFVDNVLSEYISEITAYKDAQRKVVRFI